MNLQILGPLLFALLAAIGNGFFAYSQRSATGIDNSFVFITLTLMVCILACIVAAPLFGPVNYLQTIRNNITWSIIGGLGLLILNGQSSDNSVNEDASDISKDDK